VCEECFLVQLQEYVAPDQIFSEYAYFSSYSDSWLRHAKDYVEMAAARFGLDGQSRVVEIAGNDGYPLQYSVARGVPVLGTEPARAPGRTRVTRVYTGLHSRRYFGQTKRLTRHLCTHPNQFILYEIDCGGGAGGRPPHGRGATPPPPESETKALTPTKKPLGASSSL
jgi:hypothetical protein